MSDADEAAELDVIEEIEAPAQARNVTWMIRLASILLVFSAWEIAGRMVSPLFLSSPTAIIAAAWQMMFTGELGSAIVSSAGTLLLGFTLASVLGIAIGLAIGRYKYVDAATDWLVNALYATPLIAIIPLVILWFGLGDAAKLFIVTLMSVFPVLINTSAGVRNVPKGLIDVSTAFHARESQVFIKIILPACMPYIMTGLRLGIGRAIIGMIAAEFFTAITGLGALIVKFGNQYDTASMFVPILILMGSAIGLTALIRHIEERLAPWRKFDE